VRIGFSHKSQLLVLQMAQGFESLLNRTAECLSRTIIIENTAFELSFVSTGVSRAVKVGYEALLSGADSTAAVVAAITELEDDITFDAGEWNIYTCALYYKLLSVFFCSLLRWGEVIADTG